MQKKYIMPARYAVFVILVIVLFAHIIMGDNDPLSTCKKNNFSNDRFRCLIPYFKNLTEESGAVVATLKAKDLQKEGVIDDCHLAAHIVGAENLKKYNYDPGRAFATCSMECIEGCYHGVMEEYTALENSPELNINKLLQVCDSLSSDFLLRRQCLHGIGHGILRHENGLLNIAIDTCLSFPDVFSQKTCLGGVFMQNVQNIILDDEETFFKKIPTLCELTEKYDDKNIENQCISSIGEGAMFYTGHDLGKAKKICLLLPAKYQKLCISSSEMELFVNSKEISS